MNLPSATIGAAPRLRPFRPVAFGRYTLLAELARGGMGELYLARIDGPRGFEKLCVIKKILPQLAAQPDFVARFVDEAKTLAKLTHGSIAQVLDLGLHEGEPYLALELIDGKDLRKVAARMRDRGLPVPLTVVLHVMGRVLDALAYAHRKRDEDDRELWLVHRDVSPQNILVSYEGEVKVIDFGLAKSALSTGRTNPNIVVGKFLYMSPEQARHAGTVDRRSDLYAVGLCLYELIHGRNPFDEVAPGELMARVSQPELPPLSQVEPLCPPAVAAVVTRALQPDPSQRFQSAEEFRARLQACLLDIDPLAGPESVSRFMREVFAADYLAERRLLASFHDVARTPTQAVLPFQAQGGAPTLELAPPGARVPGPDDVTVPRAPLQLRDVETRPRAHVAPREDTDPRAFADPDTDPRSDATRFDATSGADTQPRVLLGTLLPEDDPPAAPAAANAPRRRPESPAGLRRPPELARGPERDQAPTIEWERPDFSTLVTGPHPATRDRHLGGWVVAAVVLLTLGAAAYFVHDLHRSGAFLAPARGGPGVASARDTTRAANPAAASAQPATLASSAHAPAAAVMAPPGGPSAVVDDAAIELAPLTTTGWQPEWTRARAAFETLERRRSCSTAGMAALCTRFAALQADVEGAHPADADRLLPRIRAFHAAVEAKRAR